ncbi:MAG: cytidine deaminase [Candidatus Angelobacter sp.]
MSSTPVTDKERAMLLGLATQALTRAYAPYSNFQVGAAILTQDGHVFTGCNVENASYGLTNCAERSAIFTAVQQTEGKLALRAVAIVNGSQAPCSPCGACRQVIAEFGKDVVVIFQGENGFQESNIADLLPATFRLS